MTNKSWIEEIEELFSECSIPAWDGYDADPITNETRDRAIKTVHVLSEFMPKPEISPSNDGSINFDWTDSNENVIISVFADSLYLSQFWLDRSRPAIGHEFKEDAIPEIVMQKLKKFSL